MQQSKIYIMTGKLDQDTILQRAQQSRPSHDRQRFDWYSKLHSALNSQVMIAMLTLLTWQCEQAAVVYGRILQGPPEPNNRWRICVQKGGVLMRDNLPADLGLLQSSHAHIFGPTVA